MLETHNKRDKRHLINLIRKRSSDTPNFALIIGAGASVSSGVKTASQMIAEWHVQLYEQSKSTEPMEDWLRKQDWHMDDEEYSILFEKVYDQPSQRRIYIEECVKDAKPSWGYIYLSNIIAHNYFNAVFTPNFDDLLNEACFLYSDLRPIVCAHDSAVSEIRVTSARPKIIKLHGDFLYDSIKNTVRETETLEKNMRDKFMQFAREYGLIIIGYGGNDRSIMEILDTMLRSEGYFPNGVYWCRRPEDKLSKRTEDKVSKKLDRLMRRENTCWVEIEGFDEFMAELHQGLKLTLPDSVRDPYKATTERLNRFIIPTTEIMHPVIKDNIAELERRVKLFEQAISGGATKEEFDRLVPYRFLGDREYNSKNYVKALIYYEKAAMQNPNDSDMMQKMSYSYRYTEQFDMALEIAEKIITSNPNKYEGYYHKAMSLLYLNRINDAILFGKEALMHTAENSDYRAYILSELSTLLSVAGKWNEALSAAEESLQITPKNEASLINKSLALKKLDRVEEGEKILRDILPEIQSAYNRACAFALLNDKENMIKELVAAIKEDNKNITLAKFDIDFTDYREDEDFQKIISSNQL